jgi:Transcription factor WhiB
MIQEPAAWFDDPGVKCKGAYDHEGNGLHMMYPSHLSAEVARAKAVCNGLDGASPCKFRVLCLKYAIDWHEMNGVWGGTSERDRRKIQRARNKLKINWIYSLEDIRFPSAKIIELRTCRFIKRRSISERAA